MTPLALFFTLASSLSWSGFDYSRKRLVGKIRPMPLTFLVMIGQVPFFLAWAIHAGEFGVREGYWWPASGTFALNIVGNILFLWSMSVSPFSSVVPMLSFTPVFASIIGAVFLKELPTLGQMLGIALVFAGAMVFHFHRSLLKIEKGVWGMLGVALMFSIAVICDKMAIERSSSSIHAMLLCLAVALGALVLGVARGQAGDLREARGSPVGILISLIFASLGLGLQFHSYRYVYVGLFEVIKRSCGMTASLVLGYLFFREKISPRKIFGVAMMGAGVGLVLLN